MFSPLYGENGLIPLILSSTTLWKQISHTLWNTVAHKLCVSWPMGCWLESLMWVLLPTSPEMMEPFRKLSHYVRSSTNILKNSSGPCLLQEMHQAGINDPWWRSAPKLRIHQTYDHPHDQTKHGIPLQCSSNCRHAIQIHSPYTSQRYPDSTGAWWFLVQVQWSQRHPDHPKCYS